LLNGIWTLNGIDFSDPYLLTTFLLEEAVSKGAEFIQASATSLLIEDKSIKTVHATYANGSTISLPCDNLVIAAGPWTGPLSKILLPRPIPVTSYAGHSILVRPSTPLSPDCLFMTLTTRKSSYHPEIFPRASGQLYICGVNESLTLPPTPESAIPRSKDIEKLKEIADTLLEDYTIEKEQLCYRPMTSHGEPFVSAVPDVKGVYVGAGHSFWGITLGPGTGKVLSELVLHEPLSADISHLSLSPS
jgi:glycine/D-amino acid oxidase-like deaminating enzyme